MKNPKLKKKRSKDTFGVQFESLLDRGDGSENGESVDPALDV